MHYKVTFKFCFLSRIYPPPLLVAMALKKITFLRLPVYPGETEEFSSGEGGAGGYYPPTKHPPPLKLLANTI